MMISIVIPTRNRSELLDQTLHYLSRQRCDSALVEFVVVDDGSTDMTRDVVDSYRVSMQHIIYVYLEKDKEVSFSPSYARNVGIERSSGKIVVLLDCGVIVSPDFIECICNRTFA